MRLLLNKERLEVAEKEIVMAAGLLALVGFFLIAGVRTFTHERLQHSPEIMKPVSESPCVWKAATEKKEVALTFDDGPDPRFTPKVLDVLKKKHTKATFFLVGGNVHRYPNLVKREVREGHLLGNHTYHHYHLTKKQPQTVGEELDLTSDEIARVTGKRPLFMRPPYGQFDKATKSVILARGYRMTLWSTEFQELKYPNAEQDAEYVASRIKPGDIILSHDGRRAYHSRDVEMLPFLIDKLKKKGYRIVRLDELLYDSKMVKKQAAWARLELKS